MIKVFDAISHVKGIICYKALLLLLLLLLMPFEVLAISCVDTVFPKLITSNTSADNKSKEFEIFTGDLKNDDCAASYMVESGLLNAYGIHDSDYGYRAYPFYLAARTRTVDTSSDSIPHFMFRWRPKTRTSNITFNGSCGNTLLTANTNPKLNSEDYSETTKLYSLTVPKGTACDLRVVSAAVDGDVMTITARLIRGRSDHHITITNFKLSSISATFQPTTVKLVGSVAIVEANESQTDAATSSFMLTNTNTMPITLGQAFISGLSKHNIAVVTAEDTCSKQTIASNGTCTIKTLYTEPSPNNSAQVSATLNVIDDKANILATAFITSINEKEPESEEEEVTRRIPPMVTSINMPVLKAGSPATITWDITDYQEGTYSELAIFQCNSSPAESGCGAYYSATKKVTSGLLEESTNAQAGWYYNSIYAKRRTYTYTYTPAYAGEVVLRFFQKSTADKEAGKSGISALLAGGLSGAGSAFNYHDDAGRRIKATVSPSP